MTAAFSWEAENGGEWEDSENEPTKRTPNTSEVELGKE